MVAGLSFARSAWWLVCVAPFLLRRASERQGRNLSRSGWPEGVVVVRTFLKERESPPQSSNVGLRWRFVRVTLPFELFGYYFDFQVLILCEYVSKRLQLQELRNTSKRPQSLYPIGLL